MIYQHQSYFKTDETKAGTKSESVSKNFKARIASDMRVPPRLSPFTKCFSDSLSSSTPLTQQRHLPAARLISQGGHVLQVPRTDPARTMVSTVTCLSHHLITN